MSAKKATGEDQPLLYDSVTTATTFPSEHVDKAKSRWMTIEPIIFLAFVGNGTFSMIRSEYLQKRIGEDDYNYTFSDDSNISCITNTSDPDYIIQQDIQRDASNWTLYLSICSYLPLLFTAIIIGTWSDMAGRKKALVMPLLGTILQTTIYLIVVYLHLPLVLLMIGELSYGFFGGSPLIVSLSLAYIADVTTIQQRTFRVVVVETSIIVSVGSSQLAMGYFIEAKGFVPPFYLILACQVVAIAYILIPHVLYESLEPSSKVGNLSTRMMTVFRGLIDLFMNNVDNRRWRLSLITFIFLPIIMDIYGYTTVITLYAIGQPFCWSSVLVGIYGGISLSIFAICNIAGSKLLGLCLSDIWILHITLISMIASMIVLGIATKTFVVFLASVVGCVRALSIAIVRSMASKCVSASEQGVTFAFLASIDSVGAFLAPVTFQLLYAATVVNGDPGSPFYLAAGLAAVAEFVALILHCGFLLRKSGKSTIN